MKLIRIIKHIRMMRKEKEVKTEEEEKTMDVFWDITACGLADT